MRERTKIPGAVRAGLAFVLLAAVLAAVSSVAGCAMYDLAPEPAPEQPRPPVPAGESAVPSADAAAPVVEDEAVPVSGPDTAEAGEEDIAAPGTIRLSRDGAIVTAVANNRGLEIARFGPRLAGTLAPEARAMFDPALAATVSYGRRTDQLGGRAAFTFGARGGAGGISQPLAGETPADTARNVVDVLRGVIAQPQITPVIDSYNSEGEVRLSTYLPTGTTVFLTGGMTRDATNFYDAQYTGRWTFGVNQALLEGRGRAVNLVALRQAQNQQAASHHELERAVLQLVELVERGYWGLVLAREVLGIRQFGVALAQEMVDLNENLFEVGRAVEGAVLSARAERATRVADLHEAQGDVRAVTIDLLRLLNPNNEPDWRYRIDPADPPAVEQVPVDPEASQELAAHYRPELLEQQLALANRELDVLAAHNARRPRLDLTAGYGRTSLGDSFSGGTSYLSEPDFDNYSVALTFESPILNRAERARHTRARLAEAQAEAALADLGQQIEAQVRKAAIEVEKQWRRIEATEEAVASRTEELRIERDRYEAGRATNLDVLQVQRLLIEARVNAARARINYIQALTGLYAAEGTLLARRGIDVGTETE